MKEIILTIACCNECLYMETNLYNGNDYCTHSALQYQVIADIQNILQECPLIDEEVLKDAEG